MGLDLSSKKFEKLFFLILYASFLLGTLVVYVFKFNGPAIRSDGVGYYAYLPSVFVYGDITMKKFAEEDIRLNRNGAIAKEHGLNQIKGTDKYLDKYPMGVAAMMSPFFLMAHGSSLIAHQFDSRIPADGISSPFYHFFIAFGSSLYMLFGFIFLKKILDRYFKSSIVYLIILLMVFATNIFHFSTYDSVFSHAYSFFLFASFILLVHKWYADRRLKQALLLGFVAGLIVLVRPTNAIIFLFFPLHGIQFSSFGNFIRNRTKLFITNWRHIVLMILISVLVVFPQLAYWHYITGHWLVFSYPGESFDFAHPKILNVLFSVNKGLFFWAPILFFIIPGVFYMRKNEKLKSFIFPLVVYFGCTVYLISSWWYWSYGGCFGHRGFIESMVVLSIPLAAFFEHVFAKGSTIRNMVMILSCLIVALNLYLMIQYWRGYLPFDGTTWEMYVSALKNVDIVEQ